MSATSLSTTAPQKPQNLSPSSILFPQFIQNIETFYNALNNLIYRANSIFYTTVTYVIF
ncbi:hypothetical protein HMPREF1584_01333 [Gardnerella vaginalis JCP8481A]|nr:hypothetical protein HMPREF1584_01333 [Gardnerella vaginalis JCP8481A]